MTKIIIIEKVGTLKVLNVKDFSEDTLYKKAGLKSNEGFCLQHTWDRDDGLDHSIQLYAKKTGRAGQENKYDFPPPVDNTLFFGPCVLVGRDVDTGEVVDLEEDDWEEIYEYLFGGFEEIGESDDEDEEDIDTEDELEAIQKKTGVVVKQTKQGYAKDGFIVDDDEEEDTEESDEDTPPPKRRMTRNDSARNEKSKIEVQPEDDTHVEDCESELSEESYV